MEIYDFELRIEEEFFNGIDVIPDGVLTTIEQFKEFIEHIKGEKMKYVIGTGWWCDGSGKHAGSANNTSTESTRKKDFFKTWRHFIEKYTKPEKIIITDSNSPIPPDFNGTDGRYEYIKLTDNFGHASVSDTDMCGWTRSFLNGAFYAYITNADYYVYIEQDCLVVGDNIIEKIIDNLGYFQVSHGLWEHAYKVEQSFVIIRKDAIVKFIKDYTDLSEGSPDSAITPEQKFNVFVENGTFNFKELPIPYGRTRPIDFDREYFYAQHLNDEELNAILFKEGLGVEVWGEKTHKKDKY